MNFVIDHCWLIPLMPLLGAIVSGFFGARWLKGNSHWPIWIGVGISAVLSFILLGGMIHATSGEGAHTFGEVRKVFTWIRAGSFHANCSYFIDPLTAVMLSVVCGIGFLITIFAAGYMKGEEGYFRFFAYLGLFIFAMTNLVMGDNLIMLYLGWEGVGLCSYLLISYYYERPAAEKAAKKAFIVNRVGDFGFALGIMLSFAAFGTVSYFGTGVGSQTGLLELASLPLSQLQNLAGVNAYIVPGALKWIPFLLMLGAFGKSAQFPLYVWLPDAMEGPTPVSALIHAATMVTAGVYMIARCGTLFVGNHAAIITIAAVGAFTALFAATIALRQFDLKKVFAYSTVSQLGYMFIGVGVLAPTAAVFHLVTHAFFKALLFLSSGVVMHAMLGHLDMRKMSGLKRVLPITRILMLIGCAALAGFPFLAGFFSKDEIVAAAMAQNKIVWAVALVTAFITAYYTFRLYFRVFEGPLLVPTTEASTSAHSHDDMAHGTSSANETAEAGASHAAVTTGDTHRSGVDTQLTSSAHHGSHDDHHHNHEPALMILPLVVLAIGAVLAGYLNWPKEHLADFLGKSPSLQLAFEVAGRAGAHVEASHFGQIETGEVSHATFTPAMLIGGVVALAGIALAFVLHLADRARAEKLAAQLQPVTGLLEGKYWVDELYDRFIVQPLAVLGRWFLFVDRFVVDGLLWLISFVPQLSGFALKLTVQRGYLQGYAAAMLFGIVAILLFVFL